MKGSAAGLLLSLLLAGCGVSEAPIRGQVNLAGALSDPSGQYATVRPGRTFHFPPDHGEHPEFKTEWWYVTGHLRGEKGTTFGYQLTFFSTGLPKVETPAESPWSASRVMMGHLAYSEPSVLRFRSFERFSRRSLGLTGVTTDSEGVKVWLEDWSLHRTPDGVWRLQAFQEDDVSGDFELSLRLTEQKPPVLQGEGGYSRKGPQPEHASYYVSLTRLAAEGTLRRGSESHKVSGSSWFDHEWSSQPMAPGLVGWDWFSLQLSDGWELMLYLLRYEDGRLEPASSGLLVARDGGTSKLTLEQFQVEVKEHHRSARGILYPSAWKLSVPEAAIMLMVRPTMRDQEMKSSVAYWEGAVEAEGTRDGKELKGRGFVELTGYEKQATATPRED